MLNTKARGFGPRCRKTSIGCDFQVGVYASFSVSGASRALGLAKIRESVKSGGDFIMDVKKDNAMYMHIAQIASERSYAVRLKVGCVIVKNNAIISIGWNGMPTGYDNCCEMQVDGKLVTRPEVQHAELNAISKLAFNGFSSRGASIFITHSPCIHCALLIQKCGIEHVYYHEIYRDDSGIRFLQHAGIDVEQL